MYEPASADICIFDLMACIISMVGKSNLFKMSRSLLSLTEENAEEKLGAVSSFYNRITDTLDSGIQIPSQIVSDILAYTQVCLQNDDYAGIGVLLEQLDLAAGPFKDILPHMQYRSKLWQQVVEIPPLNSNYRQLGIKLYPIVYPFWSVKKSAFFRIESSMSFLQNYFILTRETEQCAPVSIRCFYMTNQMFLDEIQSHRQLSIALSPLSNAAHMCAGTPGAAASQLLQTPSQLDEKNVANVEARVMRTFCHALDSHCHIIAFPEAVGDRSIVSRMQQEMRKRPTYPALVLPPTFYEAGRNKAILLGPSGQIIHEQDKIVPFSCPSGGKNLQEVLVSGEHLNFLLIEGLGGVVTPICRDFLELPMMNLIYGSLPVHTILVPSFTPGKSAFEAAAARGRSTCSMSIWLNTCAAQDAGWFDHTYDFETVAFIEPPYNQFSGNHIECLRSCKGSCSDNLCYFNILLDGNTRKITCTHKIA